MESLLQALLAVLLPAIAVYLSMQLLKLSTAIDQLPGIVKQVLTVLEGFVFAKLGALLGVALPGSLGGFDPGVVQGLLSALVAWAIHKLFAPPSSTAAKKS